MQKYYLPLVFLVFFWLLTGDAILAQDPDYVPLAKCWELVGEIPDGRSVASDNAKERIFLANSNEIISVDTFGNVFWRNDLGGQLKSRVLVGDERLFTVVTRSAEKHEVSSLRVLSTRTGLTISEFGLPDVSVSDGFRIFFVNSNVLVVQNGADLIWIDPQQPLVLARHRLDKGSGSDIIQDGEDIVFVNSTGYLSRLSLVNMQKERLGKIQSRGDVRIFVHKSGYLIFNSSGEISFYDKVTNGRVWSGRLGGSEISVSFLDERVFVSSTDNFVYSIVLRNGKIAWMKRFGSRVSSMLFAPSNQLIVSLINEQKTYLIDTADGKTINVILADPVGEFYVAAPFVVGDRILLFQNGRVNGYRYGGCRE